MAYLLLYGNGWTQRWHIPADREGQVREQIASVGSTGTGRLSVLDPGTDSETTLSVAWALVACAVVLAGPEEPLTPGDGPYA